MKFRIGELITDKLNPAPRAEWRIFEITNIDKNYYTYKYLRNGSHSKAVIYRLEEIMVPATEKMFNEDLENLIDE